MSNGEQNGPQAIPPTTSKQPTRPRPRKGKVRHAWDAVFEFFDLSKLGNHLWMEFPHAMRKAPFILVFCLSVIVLLILRGCDKSKQIQSLSDDKTFLQRSVETNLQHTENYRLELQKSFSKVADKDVEISRMIMERDKTQLEAQAAKNSLAQWMMLAQSGNTNTPLTERMDSLTKSLTENAYAFSKAVNDLFSEKPQFELSINGSQINQESNSIVVLPSSRTIFLEVKNSGGSTAEKLRVHFHSPLSKTNLIMGTQWNDMEARATTFTNWNIWTIECAKPVGSQGGFSAETFEVSTNVSMPFQAQIDVYSVGSKTHRFRTVFIIKP